jgi:tetratricopeptide (TPR) repeat protein
MSGHSAAPGSDASSFFGPGSGFGPASGADGSDQPDQPDRALDPVDAEVERARLLIDIGRLAEAEPKLRRALASDPQHHGALANLAWLLASADRTEEAEEAARQVIKHFPEDTEGFRRMAWVLRDADRPAEAVAEGG